MAISPDKNKTFESGNYTINGVEFLTKDDTGRPIFKMKETRRGPQLMATYKTFYNGKDGPVGSLFSNGLATFALAFGVDPADLNAEDVYVLAELSSRIDAGQKDVKIWVNDKGYVGRIHGAQVPEGHYIFSKDRISSRDSEGNPVWRKTNYGESLILTLKVMHNADGTPSPYAGIETQLWIGRNGLQLWRAVAPVAFNAWLPEEKELELLTEMINTPGINLVGRIGVVNEKGTIGLVKSSLQPIRADEVVDMKTADSVPAVDVAEADALPEHIQQLYDRINKSCPGDAFDNYGNLTLAGKAWCRENLRPIANSFNPPLTSKFGEMTPDIVQKYVEAIEKMEVTVTQEEEAPW